MFIWHCDWRYLPANDSNNKLSITFGQLPLGFDSMQVKHDTIEFYFRFRDHGVPVWGPRLRDNALVMDGVAFNLTGKKLYLMSSANYVERDSGSTTRFTNPLQPEIVKYIDSNWTKLDPCFRLLAEKLYRWKDRTK